jgi:N12 class adenine-specific DNA methylase
MPAPTGRTCCAAVAAAPPPGCSGKSSARPGAPWIPAELVAQFAQQTLQVSPVTAEHIGGRWVVDVASYQRYGRLMTETWGMPQRGCNAVSLLEALCNSRRVTINTDQGVLDTQASFAAQAKSAKITDEFNRWLFADPLNSAS